MNLNTTNAPKAITSMEKPFMASGYIQKKTGTYKDMQNISKKVSPREMERSVNPFVGANIDYTA